jgi:hypothetical protein
MTNEWPKAPNQTQNDLTQTPDPSILTVTQDESKLAQFLQTAVRELDIRNTTDQAEREKLQDPAS